jgi:hypothetical protein
MHRLDLLGKEIIHRGEKYKIVFAATKVDSVVNCAFVEPEEYDSYMLTGIDTPASLYASVETPDDGTRIARKSDGKFVGFLNVDTTL